MKIRNWNKVAMDKEAWKKTVKQVKTHEEVQGREKRHTATCSIHREQCRTCI